MPENLAYRERQTDISFCEMWYENGKVLSTGVRLTTLYIVCYAEYGVAQCRNRNIENICV